MKNMKKQVVVIHGGDPFETYDKYLSFLKNYEIDFERLKRKAWKETLADKLGSDFEVIQQKMPNNMNARYSEWKIWFEKLIPFLDTEVIFVGHSLGGVFLAKYLAENKIPKKILATLLVSAPYDDKDSGESLVDFALPDKLDNFQKQGGRIFLYHSEDDNIVPFGDLNKYRRSLPNAKVKTFRDRGHFQQEDFPELVEDIQSILI